MRRFVRKGVLTLTLLAACFGAAYFGAASGGAVFADTASGTDAPTEEHIIDLDSMDLPDDPGPDIPVSADSLTPEQKAQIKAWLSAHGYAPTRAGAEAAYQDYLAGKFDNDPEVQAALGKKVAVSEETFIMDSAAAWEQAEDRRQQMKQTEMTTEATTEKPTEAVTTEAKTEQPTTEETQEQKKQRKILRDKERSHRILIIGIAVGAAVIVAGLILLELFVIGRKDDDEEAEADGEADIKKANGETDTKKANRKGIEDGDDSGKETGKK